MDILTGIDRWIILLAKRRKNPNGGEGLVIVVAMVGIAACVAFFFVIPAAVVVWWVVAEVIGLGQRKLRVAVDVGPTASEAAERASLDREIAIREAAMAAAEGEGDRSGLRRRSDGLFDQRSYLGRDLNVRIQAERGPWSDALVMRMDLDEAIQARVDRWAKRKALVAGARAGVVTFAAVGVAILVLQPALAVTVGEFNFMVAETDAPTRRLLGTLAIAGACALAVNLMAFRLRRRELRV